MYGPQDGAPVPEICWVLDQIELIDKDKKMIYCYELNEQDKNYYFVGEFSGGEYE